MYFSILGLDCCRRVRSCGCRWTPQSCRLQPARRAAATASAVRRFFWKCAPSSALPCLGPPWCELCLCSRLACCCPLSAYDLHCNVSQLYGPPCLREISYCCRVMWLPSSSWRCRAAGLGGTRTPWQTSPQGRQGAPCSSHMSRGAAERLST